MLPEPTGTSMFSILDSPFALQGGILVPTWSFSSSQSVCCYPFLENWSLIFREPNSFKSNGALYIYIYFNANNASFHQNHLHIFTVIILTTSDLCPNLEKSSIWMSSTPHVSHLEVGGWPRYVHWRRVASSNGCGSNRWLFHPSGCTRHDLDRTDVIDMVPPSLKLAARHPENRTPWKFGDSFYWKKTSFLLAFALSFGECE